MKSIIQNLKITSIIGDENIFSVYHEAQTTSTKTISNENDFGNFITTTTNNKPYTSK